MTMATDFYGIELTLADSKTSWMIVPANSVIIYLLSTKQLAFSIAGTDQQHPINGFVAFVSAMDAANWLHTQQAGLNAVPTNTPLDN